MMYRNSPERLLFLDSLIHKETGPANVAANLRVCMVRPAENVDRRFCFEVVSPMKYVFLESKIYLSTNIITLFESLISLSTP